MKKVLFLSLLLTVVIIACSRKTVATKEVATANESTEAPQADATKSNTENLGVNLLIAGKTVYEVKCTRCHALKTVELYTPDRWNAILKIMAPKAKLTDTETEQVTAYVNANAKK